MQNADPRFASYFDAFAKQVAENRVVLYMKGTRTLPACGFSAAVVQILGKLGIDFLDVNVLSNNDLREALKLYSDWPTIPQLYVDGEFVGGCDIVREMYDGGELQQLFSTSPVTPPKN